MNGDVENSPQFQTTMERLEGAKRLTEDGAEYWMAREVHVILGYPTWREFGHVIDRARSALVQNGMDASHQIVLTHKMMEVGKGATRQGDDFFLSRLACYLIAMNGDPAKPEIAAAQAYFAIQTRRAELAQEPSLTEDEKRLQLRDKVSQAHKHVSGVAQDAGVSSKRQPLFHDARYQGLYGMSARDVKRQKGLADKENIFDHVGPLELSANEFQMNLAAEVITREGVKGEARVIQKNKEIGRHVRKTMVDSRATMPENLPLAEPIKNVRKRVQAQRKLPKISTAS